MIAEKFLGVNPLILRVKLSYIPLAMNRFLPLIVFLFPLLSPASGQVTEGAVPQEFLRLANRWMISAEANQRKAAYLSWKQLGAEAMPEYHKALKAARKHHSRTLEDLLGGRSGAANPYAAHHELAEELDGERARVMALIMTDWKKDEKKVRELREEMKDLDKLRARVNRLAAADTERFDALVEAAVEGLAEVARELERFDEELESASVKDGDLRRFLLGENTEGKDLLAQQERLAATRDEVEAHAAAEKYHAGLDRWASASMKDFANLINEERALLGLPPRNLEEKLSDACEGHSADMARLGFFAHESPVPDKKTPWDRARLAGFAGKAGGENIYMGSTSHDAAYAGWFSSDGHRFIMFGGGNTLGVGISGIHWTMMTGKAKR